MQQRHRQQISLALLKKNADKLLSVSLHIIAWMSFSFMLYKSPLVKNPDSFISLFALKLLMPACSLFYANYLYLVPQVLARLKIVLFTVLNIGLLVFVAIAFSEAFKLYTESKTDVFRLAIDVGKSSLLFVMLAVIIRFSVDWFRAKLLSNLEE